MTSVEEIYSINKDKDYTVDDERAISKIVKMVDKEIENAESRLSMLKKQKQDILRMTIDEFRDEYYYR